MPDNARSDPTDIFMWRRIDSRLTTSGQPTEDQLARICDLGVSHVINLGLHEHERALADEAGAVARLGMRYIHIPVQFDNPTSADYERFRLAMRDLDGQAVHIHCIANLRVSAFLYRYRRDELGIAETSARAEMEGVWRPGHVWARFVSDDEAGALPHRYAGRDY